MPELIEPKLQGLLLLSPLVSPSGVVLSDLHMREAAASEMALLQPWTSKGEKSGDQKA